MRTANWSNNHPLARIRGWVAGNSASGTGGAVVTDGTTTVDPATLITVGKVTDGGGGNAIVLPRVVETGSDPGQLRFDNGVYLYDTDLGSNQAGVQLAPLTLNVWAEGNGGPGDLSAAGINLETGPDYVGLFISEKDSSTIQIYPDSSGGYDIELVDRGGKNWQSVGANYTTALATIGHLYVLPFAWNTASIATGVAVGTVQSGDIVLGAWIDVATAWNSTVSDLGDIITTTSSESLMNSTVNMQAVGAGTDRRKLKDGAILSAEASVLLSTQTILVKVASTGISLSAGAATAYVLVKPLG